MEQTTLPVNNDTQQEKGNITNEHCHNNNNGDTTAAGVLSPSSANLKEDSVSSVAGDSVAKMKKEMKTKSLFDEKLAQIKERRKANEIKMEQGAKEKLKKNEEIFANYEKLKTMKKQQLKEMSLKKDSKRKEVEQRKEQLLEENKKKTEAILAKSEEQTQVTLRKKKRPQVDAKKRWSWSSSGGWGGGTSGAVVCNTPLKLSPSTQDLQDPNKGEKQSPSFVELKFSTRSSITDLTHISFAQGLRSYDTTSQSSVTSLSEPTVPFNSRLLTPTKSFLAKSVREPRSNSFNNDRSRSAERRDFKKSSPPIRTSLSAHKMNGMADSKKKFNSTLDVSTTKNDNAKGGGRRSTTPQRPQQNNKTSTQKSGGGETPIIKRSLHPSNNSLLRPKQSPGVPKESVASKFQLNKTPTTFKRRDKTPLKTGDVAKTPTTASSSVTSSTSSSGKPLKATPPPPPKQRSSSLGRSSPGVRSPSVEKKPFNSRAPTTGNRTSRPSTPTTLNADSRKSIGSRAPSSGRATPRSPSTGRTTPRSPSSGRASPRLGSRSNSSTKMETTKKTGKLQNLKDQTEKKPDKKEEEEKKKVEQNKEPQTVAEITTKQKNVDTDEKTQENDEISPPAIETPVKEEQQNGEEDKKSVCDPDDTQSNEKGNNGIVEENGATKEMSAKSANSRPITNITNTSTELHLIDLSTNNQHSTSVVTSQNNNLVSLDVAPAAVADMKEEKTSKENGETPAAENAAVIVGEKTAADKEKVEAEKSTKVENKSSAVVEEKADDKQKVPEKSPKSEKVATGEEKMNGSEKGEVEEKKLTELEAFQITLAAKRREAKEKREQEEVARKERLKLQAEEQKRMAEEARRMVEEAAAEAQRQQEIDEENEKQLKEQQLKEESLKKDENVQHFIKEKKDEIEQRAKAESEKLKRKMELEAERKEKERLERKKRLDRIMQRTRGGDPKKSTSDTSINTSTDGTGDNKDKKTDISSIINRNDDETKKIQNGSENNDNQVTQHDDGGDMLFRRVLAARVNRSTNDNAINDNDVTIVDVVTNQETTETQQQQVINNTTTTLVQ